jgi:hypothetical protein
MLLITSAYAKRGAAYELWRDHFGRDDNQLIWTGDTRSMNPSFSEATIAKALADDPAVAKAEYLAEWRDDIESFVSEALLLRAIVPGRGDLAYVPGVRYVAFVDLASGGGGGDSAALAIGHRAGQKRVIDFIREVRPLFSADDVIRLFAQDLGRYSLKTVTGDMYAWLEERFRKVGIVYLASELNKSQLYVESLPAMTSGQVELPDNPRLMHQFRSLDRRTGRSGRDSVDHQPRSHDDLCNVCDASCFSVLDASCF